jgi:lipoprotein-releasing system permease protein
VFILDGFLVGLLGCALGMAAGLLIANNINAVFSLVEGLVNGVLLVLRGLLAPWAGVGKAFAIFSPTYFYLLEVPSRVLFPEALLITLFGLVSCTAAAYMASRQVVRGSGRRKY